MSSRAIETSPAECAAVEVRVRGRVQGVGFRPAVWRIAHELGLEGDVRNDSEGVVIRLAGSDRAVRELLHRLTSTPPPLSRIEAIETRPLAALPGHGFRVADSASGPARTEVAPDAAICEACTAEILDPTQRRYRYPFATCTQCGPRLSIIAAIPYDRRATTLSGFPLCPACEREYCDPSDRRFHAEAVACPACGPRAQLVRLDGAPLDDIGDGALDDLDIAAMLLRAGHIVALKGLGGYQLACDATNEHAVRTLRAAKLRVAKPFALMARDLDEVRRFCSVYVEEARELASSAGPIVVLRATGPERLPDAIAPGLRTLGFMLPTTPLHALLLHRLDRPVVMTSGNVAGEPQAIDDDEARCLGGITPFALVHDRPIAHRVDDSVVRVIGGAARVLRRARGFAPDAIHLPSGFEGAPDVLATGGELKTTFCLLQSGRAVLSPHQGDLRDVATFDAFRRNVATYSELFDHAPQALAADSHPDYLSSRFARDRARDESLPLVQVQHHHAHLAACLAENGRALDAPPVLGIVLDGIGWGADEAWWGGEFLLADYRRAVRLATFKPVALIGGDRAAQEPWRNLYAHLTAEMGWAEFAMNFAELPLFRDLSARPRAVLDAMLKERVNTPLASSCGRLFDAVAAALGICRDRQAYEGEAACRLEAIVDEHALETEGEDLAYPFTLPRLRESALPYLEPLARWRALLGDLLLGTPAGVIAARFHKGLARAIASMTIQLARAASEPHARFDTVVLSGGCFQNAVLFGETARRIEAQGYSVLSHARVPANDGGLALGQAAVAAARLLARSGH